MVKNNPKYYGKRRWTRENWKASENSALPFFSAVSTHVSPNLIHAIIIASLTRFSSYAVCYIATVLDSRWNEPTHSDQEWKIEIVLTSTFYTAMEADVELRRWEWIFIPEANLNWIDESNQESIIGGRISDCSLFFFISLIKPFNRICH